jgi:hypothetical protein
MQKESQIYYHHLSQIQGDTCLYKGLVYEGQTKHEVIYDHRDFDGLSAMIKTLKLYHLFYPKMYSGLQARKKPSFLKMMKAFINFRLSMPYQPKMFKLNQSTNKTHHQASHDLFLTKSETKKIEQDCKKNHVSLNAYLLFHLKELLKEFSHNDGKKTIFMLPVNLREEVDENTDFGNEVSFIDVMIGDNDNIKDIHEQIQTKFKNQLQWGSYFATKMISFFPKFLHQFLIKDYIQNTHRTGLFSSMGVWDKKEILPATHVGAIPVNFSHMPFSISVIHWQNALYFGLSIHSKLQMNDKDAQNILIIFKNKLLHKDLI